MLLHLVRHGRPLIQPGLPASTWPLEPSANNEELRQLRRALKDRAPTAAWYSSDEPKAVATAHLLTTVGQVQVWRALREAHRFDWFATHEEFRASVLDAFSQPSRPARPGWEPLDDTRRRISEAVGQIVDENGDDVVLVGHGTAWTLLLSELTGTEPDLTAWTKLRTPDLCTLDLDTRTVSHRWGEL